MDKINNDELDLFQLFDKLKAIVNNWIVKLFNAIDYIYKYKIIIGILIIVGVGLGYFSQKATKLDQKATALVKVNFKTVDYVYSEIEQLNEKLKEKDSLFFDKNGFRADTLEMSKIEIKPIVNLNDILEKYELNDRKLEGLLKNLEFDDEEIKLYETFTSEYKYHKINFEFSPVATNKTIKQTIEYLNNNPLLQELKETIITDVKSQIENNKKSIRQIDHVIDTYQTNESLPSPSEQIFVVDKNFSIHVLFERKLELQQLNESLNTFLAQSKDVVVLVNKPDIVKEKKGVIGNKIILYPLLLVSLFLLLSYFRYIFIKLRKIAEQTKQNS